MTANPSGWPCAAQPSVPPSVDDRQSAASADEYLPQILALTPRGAAWGTDEAGDGRGASPVMRQFWRVIAGWAKDNDTRDFQVAMQCYPSAVTVSLADWENELGLPAPCTPAPTTTGERVAAVRARFGAMGGTSPAYLICFAQALGFAVTIEEPTGFMVDVSELVAGHVEETWFVCGPDGSEVGPDGDRIEGFSLAVSTDLGDELAGIVIESAFQVGADGSEIGANGDPLEGYSARDPRNDIWGDWIVHVEDQTVSAFTATGGGGVVEAWFVCGEDGSVVGPDGDPLESYLVMPSTEAGSMIGPDGDPMESYTPALALECEIGRIALPHTRLHFAYDLPVPG